MPGRKFKTKTIKRANARSAQTNNHVGKMGRLQKLARELSRKQGTKVRVQKGK